MAKLGSSTSLQFSLFPPESAWRPPRLSDLPPDWTRHPRIGLDTETCDPQLKDLGCGARRGAWVCGYSFCLEGTRPWYVPLRHVGGDNVEDPAQAMEYLRAQAAAYQGEIVGANLAYDLDMLAQLGVVFHPNARFLDVQVAEPLLDELQFSYSLDSILERHGMPLKEETLLIAATAAFGLDTKNPKKTLFKLPARYVGPYAEADAQRPLELLRKQEEELSRQGLGRVWALETAVLPVLLKMRQRGVRIDFDQLDRVERFSRAEEGKAWGEVLRHSGVSIKVGDGMKSEVVAQAFAALDIPVPLTPSTRKPSIDKLWLETVKHPVAAAVRRARKMSQLRTTFVASVRDHQINGRIHCTFNQLRMQKEGDDKRDGGAAYGRLSCSDPNLQQQPARDPELGPMWRSVYLAEEDKQWASLDYSTQEPRLALHLACVSGEKRIGRRAHQNALAMAQRYWDDPTVDSHNLFCQMVYGDDIINEEPKAFKNRRTRLKNINLGVTYGEGGAKLCKELGFPTRFIENRNGALIEIAGEEGQALLDLVDERAPYLKATSKAIEAVAKARGYITTIGGRRCRFPRNEKGELEWTWKAFNRGVQGGAADQTKTAMVALDQMGAWLQLQVHDEFDLPVDDREEALRYARVMETCVELKVPSRVDVELGPSWGQAK